MGDIYFTLEQAESKLAEISMHLTDARKLKREIESIVAGCDYDTIALDEQRPKIQKLVKQLSEKMEILEEIGVYVKDLDIGLCDFLSTFDGRDIFLCWKLGEPHVKYWHELDEGFATRQEIIDMGTLYLDNDFDELYEQRTGNKRP